MDLNSPLFDRIRIRPEADDATGEPRCQHPGCKRAGTHRAPMGRMREGEYFQFCLEHVQDYNKRYNYFSGMGDDAVAAYHKDSLTGHRPTQKMNVHAQIDPRMAKVDGAAEILERLRRKRSEVKPTRKSIGKVAIKALETLGLEETATAEEIKHRFKELVKRFHPDANGGDRSMEQRMQAVVEAHNTLKKLDLV
jgi:curved DNA-binding protein CbpA